MAVYSLVAEPGTQNGEVIRVDVVLVELADRKKLHPEDISVNGQDDHNVKLSARRGGWIAYEALKAKRLIPRRSDLPQSGVVFDFAGGTSSQISGPSAGLCFLIKMAQQIVEEFLFAQGHEVPVCDFAATGVLTSVHHDEQVARVEAIEVKIQSALGTLEEGAQVLYPRANAPLDETLQHEAKRKKIDLVAIDTPRQALDVLLKKYELACDRKTTCGRRCVLVLLGGLCGVVILAWLACKLLSPIGVAPPEPVLPVINAQVFYRNTEDRAVPLPAEMVLTEGDVFRVHLKVDRPCYPYVIEIDSANRMTWLFPFKPHSRPLDKGAYWAPEDEEGGEVWLRLDHVPGEETILILATTRPSEWMESLREHINQSKRLPAVQRRELRERLLGDLKRAERERRGAVERKTVRHQ